LPRDAGGAPLPPRRWTCGIHEAIRRIAAADPSGEHRYFFRAFRTCNGAPACPGTNVLYDETVGQECNPADPNCQGLTLDDMRIYLTDQVALGPLTDDAATPLAGAYCDSIEFLKTFRANHANTGALALFLESDGLENSTTAGTECFGVDSASIFDNASAIPAYNPSPPFNASTPGPITVNNLLLESNPADLLTSETSWQALMLDKGMSGEVHQYVPLGSGAFIVAPTGITTFVSFLDPGFLPFRSLGQIGDGTGDGVGDGVGEGTGEEEESPPGALADITDDPLLSFFNGLASATGGRLVQPLVPSIPGDPFGIHVQPGDADDSGCVDAADITLIDEFLGQRVSEANPLSFGADVTTDGIIDPRDYLLAKANFGEGCATPPGAVPLLGDVLFGFEDPANWSSPQTAVSTTTLRKTEGLFGLVVGGTSWREVRSVPFDTALLPPATPRLAFDIFIPGNPVNPFWLGQAQAYVTIPSARIFNAFLGAVELTGRPLAAFTTVTFNVPANIRNALNASHPNVTFSLVINSADTGHVFDNLRFLP
jgi:dockerin type I repeat protein